MQSKNRLKEKYRHYAGVIVDMYYDHFLAKNFDQYTTQPLASFAEEQYILLQKYWSHIPEKGQRMLPYMMRGNWLLNYAKPEGIHRALTGLSRRTKFDSKLEQAIQDLLKYYDPFEEEFTAFFKEIRIHISQFREDLI